MRYFWGRNFRNKFNLETSTIFLKMSSFDYFVTSLGGLLPLSKLLVSDVFLPDFCSISILISWLHNLGYVELLWLD